MLRTTFEHLPGPCASLREARRGCRSDVCCREMIGESLASTPRTVEGRLASVPLRCLFTCPMDVSFCLCITCMVAHACVRTPQTGQDRTGRRVWDTSLIVKPRLGHISVSVHASMYLQVYVGTGEKLLGFILFQEAFSFASDVPLRGVGNQVGHVSVASLLPRSTQIDTWAGPTGMRRKTQERQKNSRAFFA